MTTGVSMTKVGVIAHRDKMLGGGLGELRDLLEAAGVVTPPWSEVSKSKHAPDEIRKMIDGGVDRVLVWGGDGTVRRSIDTIVGDGLDHVSLGILPAGTANLLAKNLNIPVDLEAAVDIAVHGAPRAIDVGVMNGEHFAVMGGTGFDALMIKDADDNQLKEKFGRVGYVRATIRSTRMDPVKVRVELDGREWFSGKATCVLVGNVGTILGGVTAFADASPTDGRLDVGVVQAKSRKDWMRVAARGVTGRVGASPFVNVATAEKIKIELKRKMPWEVDGGDQTPTKTYKIRCLPGAVRICQPAGAD
ncbi:MAG TPA: diacylglycerol kinase family protein [Ilumatobacteraceae bacterium]